MYMNMYSKDEWVIDMQKFFLVSYLQMVLFSL